LKLCEFFGDLGVTFRAEKKVVVVGGIFKKNKNFEIE